MDKGLKKYCLYLSDERGSVYAIKIDDLLNNEKITKAKNAMKRTNYYPHRT